MCKYQINKDCPDSTTCRKHGVSECKIYARLSKRECRERKSSDLVNQYLQATINSHKYHGYEVKVTKEELRVKLESTRYCKYCGTELVVGAGRDGVSRWNGVSWDRRDNGKEMNLDNTDFICYSCNKLKGARSQEEFEEFIIAMANRMLNGYYVPEEEKLNTNKGESEQERVRKDRLKVLVQYIKSGVVQSNELYNKILLSYPSLTGTQFSRLLDTLAVNGDITFIRKPIVVEVSGKKIPMIVKLITYTRQY